MREDTTSASDSQGREIQGRHIASATAEARAGGRGVAISAGARTPEELETLFEDTLVLRDCQTLAGLFEDGALLVTGDGRSARGGEEIAQLALATWEGEYTYVADPRHIMQARNIALIVTEQGMNVMHRSSDSIWRYAIVRLSFDGATA